MHYIHLARTTELPDISRHRPFRAVIIAEHFVSSEVRYEISQWLVDSGCLYVMVWGRDCTAWDYAVDTVNLEQFDYDDIPDEHLVMTTTHDDESLEELFFFATTAPTIRLWNSKNRSWSTSRTRRADRNSCGLMVSHDLPAVAEFARIQIVCTAELLRVQLLCAVGLSG